MNMGEKWILFLFWVEENTSEIPHSERKDWICSADLLTAPGLVEERSSAWSSQQFKSPPSIKWCWPRSGRLEKRRTKKEASSIFGAYTLARTTFMLNSFPVTITNLPFLSAVISSGSKTTPLATRIETPLAFAWKVEWKCCPAQDARNLSLSAERKCVSWRKIMPAFNCFRWLSTFLLLTGWFRPLTFQLTVLRERLIYWEKKVLFE